MTRLPHWRARFEGVIDDLRLKPFAWNSNDCGPALVGRTIEALTGEDIAAAYRDKYHDAASALRLVRAAGFEDLADLVASLLPEIHPSQARIGDVAAFEIASAFKSALGVVNGERVFVLRPEGIGTMDLLQAKRAFRVG